MDCQQSLLEQHLLGRKITRVRFGEQSVELHAGEVCFVSLTPPVILSSHARYEFPDDSAREALVNVLGDVIMAVECVSDNHIGLRLDSGYSFFTDLASRTLKRPLAQLRTESEGVIGQW